MSYSKRYIEFPVIIIYKLDRDAELNENEEPLAEATIVESFVRLNPLDIQSYSPDTNGEFPTSADQLICTRVTMKAGNDYVVNMPINDFEDYLNECYDKLHG